MIARPTVGIAFVDKQVAAKSSASGSAAGGASGSAEGAASSRA